MPDKGIFKAIDYLGECVDILYLDPVNLGATEGKKNRRVFQFEKYKDTAGGVKIPLGSQYGAGNIGTEDSQTVSSTDTGEFQDALSNSYAYNAGFGEIFSFSLSKSVKSTRSQVSNAERVSTYTEARKVSGNLELIPDMKSQPLVLDDLFAQKVAELPGDASDPQQLKKYDDFIKAFGTHFMYKVTMGGHAYQSCEIRKTSKQNKETTEEDWKAVANGAYKGATAGAESTEYQKHIQELQQKYEFSASGMTWSPANGASANLKTWMGSVDDDPVICACGLVALSHVLNARFFPSDPQIGEKQRLLKERLKKYIMETGVDSGLVRADQPFSIVSLDGKMALANVDGQLKVEAASDDPRQQWTVEMPQQETFLRAAYKERTTVGSQSNIPLAGSENTFHFIKSVVSQKYLRQDFQIRPLRDHTDQKGMFGGFSFYLRPVLPGDVTEQLKIRGQRFLHHNAPCLLETQRYNGMALPETSSLSAVTRVGATDVDYRMMPIFNGDNPADRWKIVRKYDPVAEVDEAPGSWGNAS